MCATGKGFGNSDDPRVLEMNRFAMLYHLCKGNSMHAYIAHRLEVAANRPERLKLMKWRAGDV